MKWGLLTFFSQINFINEANSPFLAEIMAYEVLGVNLILLLATFSAFCILTFLVTRRIKKGILRKTTVLILAVVAVSIITIDYISAPSYESTLALTGEEIEVDLILSDYYSSMNDRSVSEVLEFFSKEAVLITFDGNGYKGIHEIRTYYEGMWRIYVEYRISEELFDIEVTDGFAKASYCTMSFARYPSATTGGVRSFHEDFVLVKEEDNWKIIGLTTNSDWCVVEDSARRLRPRGGPFEWQWIPQ